MASHGRGDPSFNLWFFRSGGASFEPPALWKDGVSGFSYDSSRLIAGDFDSDGRDDIVASHGRGDPSFNLWFFRSAGAGFDAPGLWRDGAPGFDYRLMGVL